MSEFTEKDLIDEIVQAAARVEEIDIAEITVRTPAALTGEPDLVPDAKARPESAPIDNAANNGVVLDLTREGNDRTRGTDDMTKRLWIMGLAAAAIVGVLLAIALSRDADSVITDDNIPTTTAPATTTSEPESVETGQAPTTPSVAEPLIEGETIQVPGNPRSPVEFNGQLWSFIHKSGDLQRIDPETNEVVESLPLSEGGLVEEIYQHLGAVVSDEIGLWVVMKRRRLDR